MNWPQITLLVFWMFGFISKCHYVVEDLDLSSTAATLAILILLASYVVTAYVLHVGGFW